MNREEAIEKIINGFCKLRVWCELYPDDCQKEDCEMWWAIEALQNLSKPNNGLQGSDLINRRDAIKATCNAICEYDVPHYPNCDQIKYCDEIQALISLPSAEPNTKCIAQIRIDRDDMEDSINEKVNEIVDKMVEPKTGNWIRYGKIMDIGDVQELVCDVCRETVLWVDDHYPNDEKPKFCPNCGADMRGEQDDSISD